MLAMSKSQDSKEEVRDLLRTVRNEVQKITKELATATQGVVESTEKAVREISPKVSATLDETIKDASVSFHRAMGNIDKQTKTQQVKLLRSYKSFLSKQADAIDKRLRKLNE